MLIILFSFAMVWCNSLQPSCDMTWLAAAVKYYANVWKRMQHFYFNAAFILFYFLCADGSSVYNECNVDT